MLVTRLVDVEKAREHEIGDLLDDGERIRDSALPELKPKRRASVTKPQCVRLHDPRLS